MRLGDVVTKPLRWTEVGRRPTEHGTAEGRVIYIHPKKRFFTVEFRLGDGGTIRETYTN